MDEALKAAPKFQRIHLTLSAAVNDAFLRACNREKVSHTPVWFMRQAGRYLPGYRALRQRYSLLELAHTPELAAEVTLEPVNLFDLDAAILFADILLILEPMGVAFSFEKGEGPRIHEPVRTAHQIDNLKIFDAAGPLGYVAQAIRAGAAAIIGQESVERESIPFVKVADAKIAEFFVSRE